MTPCAYPSGRSHTSGKKDPEAFPFCGVAVHPPDDIAGLKRVIAAPPRRNSPCDVYNIAGCCRRSPGTGP